MVKKNKTGFWKDKHGNVLDSKEFLEKWKQGIQSVTPLQQARIVYRNTWLIIFGISLGLVITIINYKTLWWLAIILAGALINTLVQQLGNYQKYKQLEKMEKAFA